MTQPESGRAMGSVLSTLRVLEEVAARQPIGVSELARATGMPKSTVHRCLVTLREAGWLRVVDSDRARWGVTSKPLGIGLAAAGQEGLRDIAQPVLEELRDATDETIHLAVRDGSSLLILLRKDSRQAVRTFVEVGTRAPLHATASGLAILAKMDPAEVGAVLDRGMERFTPTTIVNRAMLLEEIERTGRRGYALNDSAWWRPDVSAVAAAIVNAGGRPVAAVTISVPSSRFEQKNEPMYAKYAVDAADRISAALRGI
jgi:IclR family transcriptional regulator, acetate operon repressor